MKPIIFYISGHGFGHSSRMGVVINELIQREPERRIIVKTSAPEWFFREQINGKFSFHHLECDIGVIQSDSLNLNPQASLKAYADFLADREKVISNEIKFVREVDPQIIVGDIPPLAFKVAKAAGVPSLAIGNFCWDWIYEPYVESYPEYRYIISTIRDDYGKADLLLRLPFSGDMDAFPLIRDIPLIARRSHHAPDEVRDLLGLPKEIPMIILSFGGFWLGEDYYRKLSKIDDCIWLASERVAFNLPSIRNVDRGELHRLKLGYPDLVNAADVVVTKPGYGILSECIANRTKMLYTSRGEFREYPILVEGVEKHLPSAFISQEKLKTGDFRDELFQLLNEPDIFIPLPINGAETVVEIIGEWAVGSGQ
jgi:Glycosyl transferase family 1